MLSFTYTKSNNLENTLKSDPPSKLVLHLSLDLHFFIRVTNIELFPLEHNPIFHLCVLRNRVGLTLKLTYNNLIS